MTTTAAEHIEHIARHADTTRSARIRRTGKLTSVTTDLADVIGADVVLNMRGTDLNALAAVLNGDATEFDRATVRDLARDLAAARFGADADDMIVWTTRNV